MDLEAFQRELIDSSMIQVIPSNAQEPVVLCNETLISLLDKHGPEGTKRVPVGQTPLGTARVTEAKKERRRAERAVRKRGLQSIVHKQIYGRWKNKCTH